AAGDDPLLRLDDVLLGRRLDPAASGSHRRHLRIRPVVSGLSRDLDPRPAVHRPLATPERPGRHPRIDRGARPRAADERKTPQRPGSSVHRSLTSPLGGVVSSSTEHGKPCSQKGPEKSGPFALLRPSSWPVAASSAPSAWPAWAAGPPRRGSA